MNSFSGNGRASALEPGPIVCGQLLACASWQKRQHRLGKAGLSAHLPIADPDPRHLRLLFEEARSGSIADQQMIRCDPPHLRPRSAPIAGCGGAMIAGCNECVAGAGRLATLWQDGDLRREAGGGAAVSLKHHSIVQPARSVGPADRAVRAAVRARAQSKQSPDQDDSAQHRNGCNRPAAVVNLRLPPVRRLVVSCDTRNLSKGIGHEAGVVAGADCRHPVCRLQASEPRSNEAALRRPAVRSLRTAGAHLPDQKPMKSALVRIVPGVTVANRIASPAPLPSASYQMLPVALS